jgi:autotransporter-associated beta strand protein
MMFSKVRILALVSAVAVVHSAAVAGTVTLAPPEGVTTNVLSLFTGDTAVEVAGPGTVKLNPSNMHNGGTTLSGGTLVLSGDIPAGGPSPVGTGTFTVSGGTLRGTGTFGGNITGTGAFAVEAPDGWTWSGDNTFDEAVTLSDGALEIASGTTTFSLQFFLGTQGGTGEGVSLAMSGGTVMMKEKNLFLSPGSRTKSTFTMTGGAWNMNNHRIIAGYQTTYATNVTDISGTAAVTNSEYCYTYSGAGNCWSLNVHDGGLFTTKGSLYANGSGAVIDISASDGGEIRANKITSTSGSTTTASVTDGGVLGIATAIEAPGAAVTRLSIDGGIVRNDSTASGGDNNYFAFFQANSGGNNGPTVAIGPKGATFRGGGKTAKYAQLYKDMSAIPAEPGETAQGVTFDGGNWAYYTTQSYEGPTVIRNGASLFLSGAGALPDDSDVTVGSGSQFRIGNTDKSVASLTLEEGATLGFGSKTDTPPRKIVVSTSVTLPSSAKIALYNANTPVTTASNAAGTYTVLQVPAAYADALRAVNWSCVTAASGNIYTFAVATSGGTATLSMTIADAPSGTFAISGDTALGGTLTVSGDITIGSGATLAASPINGSASGGSITINNGGTLDASGGNIRPVDASGNKFHLYLNEGGTLVVNQINGVTSGAAANEAQATAMFHFNGGTIYPVAFESDANGLRYLLNYQTALVDENGMVIDLSKWSRPAGYDIWVRSTLQGNVNHDPNCVGADGGITVKATGDDRALVCFGGRFKGSTLTGGILAEDGAIVAATTSGLEGQTLTLQPGSRFRPYNTTTIMIGDLTFGEAGATKAVVFDCSNSTTGYGVVVTNTLSILSPVEFSVAPGWNYDSALSSGTYTALVYQATCSVDPALFRLPANAPTGATLAAEEVTLTGGDYAGWKALVITTANDLPLQNGAPATISDGGDYAYGNIYVGDFGVVANNTLTVSDGTVTADTLHLAYQPGIGTSAADGVHLDVFNQTGGKVSVQTLQTHWVGGNDEATAGRADTEINLSGGLLEVVGNVELAYNRMKSGRTSTVNVSGGRLAVGGNMLLIRYSGGVFTAAGILNVTDGEVDVKGIVDLSRTKNQATGTKNGGIWLRGGVLKAENVIQTMGDCSYAYFYFDGGTYAPYGAAAANRTMQGLNKAYVSTNGAIIDTSALPAGETYTIAQALLTDPALDGAADGGLVKKGAGTLALSGANTFTGPVKVEAGTLVAANADALSSAVEVADGAVLDLGENALTVSSIAASGAVDGNLTVTNAVVLSGNGSILSVDGNLTLGNRAAIDFDLVSGSEAPAVWTPVAAVSGRITVPERIKVRNAGANFTRADTCVIDGVLYAKPTTQGLMLIMR